MNNVLYITMSIMKFLWDQQSDKEPLCMCSLQTDDLSILIGRSGKLDIPGMIT